MELITNSPSFDLDDKRYQVIVTFWEYALGRVRSAMPNNIFKVPSHTVGSRGSDGEGESMYQNSGRHRITAPPFLINRSDILRRRSKAVR